MSLKPFAEIVDVKPRFGRSVNLERDFYNQISLDGYVLTTTSRQALGRLLQVLTNENSEKAFTLTGPYGTGKSTFALFAAKAFEDQKQTSPAHKILEEKAPKIAETFKEVKPNFLPILVSGSREPIGQAILRGIRTALENLEAKEFNKFIIRVKSFQKKKGISGKQLIKLLKSISEKVNEADKGKGILLVIDELGKLLEYTAINPEKSDIFLLQELAEATKTFEVPFFLITILHQAFERYADRLGRHERVEWMKVQGRFEDLAFQEPSEQILHILKSAFEINIDLPEAKELVTYGDELGEKAFELGLCGSFKQTACTNLLKSCMPLHPTVALTLGHIFRRFGQNERSLFAFLTSNEAFGLKEFLRDTIWDKKNPETVRLDRIYDYLITAMGSALYAGAESRKWAEIDSALNRLIDPSKLEVRLLKAIGLLGVIGELGNLKSSEEVLTFALEDKENSTKDIDKTLENLQKKSIVTFRKYNDTLAIWEGSDVNLDERFREAEKNIDLNASLAENLTNNFEARPLVAKRHTEDTGTLRFFEIVYTDPSSLVEKINEELEEADGRILYVLTGNEDERNKLNNKIRETNTPSNILIAVPQNLANLREAVFNVSCWQWVRRNTPELQSDRSARTELSARLFEAEHAVTHWLNDLQTDTTEENCRWFYDRVNVEIENTRKLQNVLSEICDRTYNKAPILNNELLNRRRLSSAASGARRLLFEAMHTKADKPKLGIEGYPPQLSMYLSILNHTGLHTEKNGKYGFYKPEKSSSIYPVWNEIEEFLNTTEINRREVGEVFDILKKLPFGLKDEIIPVLFLAVILHFDSEAALYEKDSFLPKLTGPILDRLCKTPSNFTVQLCRIGEIRSQVIEKLAEKLLPENISSNKKGLEVLTLVKPLVLFTNELNEYTKFTRKISPEGQKIRQALLSAREPDKLLFETLPKACGFSEITSNSDLSIEDTEKLAKALQNGLSEIKRAYPALLDEIEKMIASAFGTDSKGSNLRNEVSSRVKLVSEHAVSPKLKSFIIRSSDDETDLDVWLESLGALLAAKPVHAWHDDDIAQFQINLAGIARSFLSLETLTFELNNRNKENVNKDSNLIRLSLTRLGEPEAEQVLNINPEEVQKIEQLETAIEDIFTKAGLNGNTKLRLTVLANLSHKLMKKSQ